MCMFSYLTLIIIKYVNEKNEIVGGCRRSDEWFETHCHWLFY